MVTPPMKGLTLCTFRYWEKFFIVNQFIVRNGSNTHLIVAGITNLNACCNLFVNVCINVLMCNSDRKVYGLLSLSHLPKQSSA